MGKARTKLEISAEIYSSLDIADVLIILDKAGGDIPVMLMWAIPSREVRYFKASSHTQIFSLHKGMVFERKFVVV